MLFWPVVSRSPTGDFATVPGLFELKPPTGGHRRPTFYSRRFCERVCRRTKSFRRTCNLKGNFACGSYGGFLAGSWQILGTFSAESRQDLAKISLPLAKKSFGGPTNSRKPRGSQRMTKSTKREPKGGQGEPKWRPKGAERSKKGGQREHKGSPKRPQNGQKSKHFF